jgi:PD-(D/E)XK nuclease superfamily
MEVHRQLGRGFDEILYKNAVQYEFSTEGIEFEGEREFEVKYKSIILPHLFLRGLCGIWQNHTRSKSRSSTHFKSRQADDELPGSFWLKAGPVGEFW